MSGQQQDFSADSEDEIFVHAQGVSEEENAGETCDGDEPARAPEGSGKPQDPSENDPQNPPALQPDHADAPYGYTKSGRPRKRPLRKPSEETQQKRRAALEKGRQARAAKILARKQAVVAFFGEESLRSHTLKDLEAAMADAKASLKSTTKKVWRKQSKTTLPSERVIGRTLEPKMPPEPAEKPAEKAPEKAPDLRANPEKAPEKPPEPDLRDLRVNQTNPKSAFRPVSATPPPIVWRPKAKKRLY